MLKLNALKTRLILKISIQVTFSEFLTPQKSV
jgi:hypothetical protein